MPTAVECLGSSVLALSLLLSPDREPRPLLRWAPWHHPWRHGGSPCPLPPPPIQQQVFPPPPSQGVWCDLLPIASPPAPCSLPSGLLCRLLRALLPLPSLGAPLLCSLSHCPPLTALTPWLAHTQASVQETPRHSARYLTRSPAPPWLLRSLTCQAGHFGDLVLLLPLAKGSPGLLGSRPCCSSPHCPEQPGCPGGEDAPLIVTALQSPSALTATGSHSPDGANDRDSVSKIRVSSAWLLLRLRGGSSPGLSPGFCGLQPLAYRGITPIPVLMFTGLFSVCESFPLGTRTAVILG